MDGQLLARIDARLAALAISDNDASSRTGMGRSLIRDLRRRARKNPLLRVRNDTLDALATALETTVAYLLSQTDNPSPHKTPRPVPVLDALTISGKRSPHERPPTSVVFPTELLSPRAFAFIVTDESMHAEQSGRTLRPGDLIIVDPDVTREPTDAVLAIVGGEVMVRQYRERRDAKGEPLTVLAPLNPAWPTLELKPPTEGEVIGVVVEHRRAFNPRRQLFVTPHHA